MLKVESFTPLKKSLALLAVAAICAFALAATTSTFRAAPAHAASACRWLGKDSTSQTVISNYSVFVEIAEYVESGDTSAYCGKWETEASLSVLHSDSPSGKLTPELLDGGGTLHKGTAVPFDPTLNPDVTTELVVTTSSICAQGIAHISVNAGSTYDVKTAKKCS